MLNNRLPSSLIDLEPSMKNRKYWTLGQKVSKVESTLIMRVSCLFFDILDIFTALFFELLICELNTGFLELIFVWMSKTLLQRWNNVVCLLGWNSLFQRDYCVEFAMPFRSIITNIDNQSKKTKQEISVYLFY